jgi:catechol 2,3-dioxygenase-like lactoylglutathione lyase family enzyme
MASAGGAGEEQRVAVLGVDHLNLRVADLERALRFYRDVLGLREVRRNTRAGGSVSLLALRAGNAIVFLQPAPGYVSPADSRHSGLDHFSIEIEATDPERLAAWLRERGVEIVEGPVKRFGAHGDGTSIYVKDPDGHRLEIKQYSRQG